ncbi:MAG: GTP cyclohydrolase I FolE [Actinobacteria bacterium]|nr:GTP cyclohydrolase I FolE [Actinomycetota bacterium]MBU4178865.1 GTP cyclohydrolase I FolE [Actinomycetota bacterium]MBU4219212.1 GTP cyclohydrolase I FolE [Actinomycetota bacterium]MBU4359055.1 GTP cyclohydrolase I FolE [Actinomycetota bacterium]MBU4392934.1 GTP cyclohydrolase I FolE [Actinomycetota bacterium]
MDDDKIKKAVTMILEAIGEDPEREGLVHTPERVASMYQEIFSGFKQDPLDILKVLFAEKHEEMIIVKDIPLYSICEHHLMPFIGKAHVAYVPGDSGQITGISKLARVVDVLSKRLQVQERLTTQVADALMDGLDALGALVVVEAEHLCMSMRGVKKPGTVTVTSAVRGIFYRSPASRAEAMSLLMAR